MGPGNETNCTGESWNEFKLSHKRYYTYFHSTQLAFDHLHHLVAAPAHGGTTLGFKVSCLSSPSSLLLPPLPPSLQDIWCFMTEYGNLANLHIALDDRKDPGVC